MRIQRLIYNFSLLISLFIFIAMPTKPIAAQVTATNTRSFSDSCNSFRALANSKHQVVFELLHYFSNGWEVCDLVSPANINRRIVAAEKLSNGERRTHFAESFAARRGQVNGEDRYLHNYYRESSVISVTDNKVLNIFSLRARDFYREGELRGNSVIEHPKVVNKIAQVLYNFEINPILDSDQGLRYDSSRPKKTSNSPWISLSRFSYAGGSPWNFAGYQLGYPKSQPGTPMVFGEVSDCNIYWDEMSGNMTIYGTLDKESGKPAYHTKIQRIRHPFQIAPGGDSESVTEDLGEGTYAEKCSAWLGFQEVYNHMTNWEVESFEKSFRAEDGIKPIFTLSRIPYSFPSCKEK